MIQNVEGILADIDGESDVIVDVGDIKDDNEIQKDEPQSGDFIGESEPLLESEKPAEEPEKKRKRPHPDPMERMRRKAQLAQERAYQAKVENERLRAALREKEEILKERIAEQQESRENELRRNIKVAEYGVQRAIEEKDPSGQAQFSSMLAQYHADLKAVEQERKREESSELNVDPYANSYQQEDDVEIYDDHVEEFFAENPYLDERSPRFDPELGNAAAKIGERLQKALMIEGREDLIGTPDYLNEIRNELRRSVGLFDNESMPSKRNRPSGGYGGVAPVRGGTVDYGRSGGGISRIQLTPIEQAFALSIEMGPRPDGTPRTDKEKLIIFARSKARTMGGR